MVKWIDEYSVPEELLNLLNVRNLPDELRKEIVQAIDEVDSSGAVTYPTKARVEFYLHKYQNFIENLNETDFTS